MEPHRAQFMGPYCSSSLSIEKNVARKMSLIMLLADDTKTFQEIGTETDQEENRKELTRRVDKIARWARDWKMEINPGQLKVMHLGKKIPGSPTM